MVGLVALYTAILASKTVVVKQLPESVIQVLGSNVVLTTNALDWIDVESLSYSLVSLNYVVREVITGAIIAGDYNQLSDQFYTLKSQLGWVSRSHLLVVSSPKDALSMKGRWAGRPANVMFINDFLYVYNPFRNELIQVSNETSLKQVLKSRWHDLYGYSIIIGLYCDESAKRLKLSPGEGTDVTTLYELMKYWNMTPILFPSMYRNYELEFPNEDVVSRRIQFSINPRLVTGGLLANSLEFTSTVLNDAIVIVLKEAPKLHGWEVFAKIFNWQMLVALLLTTIVTSLILMMMPGKVYSMRAIPLALRSMFSIPMKNMPDKLAEQFLLGPTMLFSTVIVNVYLASLYHIIKVGKTRKKIETLEELSKKGIPVFAYSNAMRKFFLAKDNHEVRHLGNTLQLDRISNKLLERHAYVIKEHEFQFLVDTRVIDDNVYIVDEKLMSFTMSYVLKRGSIYFEPLSDFASRVFETGLRTKWYSMTVARRNEANIGKIEYRVESSDQKPLNIHDIEVAFFAIFVGLAISCIIFLIEIIYNHLMRRKPASTTSSTREGK